MPNHYEKRHGLTPDISACILFTFWEKILYLETANSYPDSKELPGHFIGIAKNVGDALTFVILNVNGERIHRRVIRSASGKPLAGFSNLRFKHTEYDPSPEEPPKLAILEPIEENPSVDNGGDIEVERTNNSQTLKIPNPNQNPNKGPSTNPSHQKKDKNEPQPEPPPNRPKVSFSNKQMPMQTTSRR